MKSVKYVPSACKGESKKIDGYLVLKVPNLDEHLNISELRGARMDSDGNISAEKIPVITVLRQTLKIIKPFFLEVALTKADGSVVSSFDEMSEDPDCHPIMIEVASKYVSGFQLGNA